jgi:hypothetical protein
MSKAPVLDLETHRRELQESFAATMPNPQDAAWAAKQAVERLRLYHPGESVPTRAAQEKAQEMRNRDARAYELAGQGVPAPVIALRLGGDRSTIYRALSREQARRKNEAA